MQTSKSRFLWIELGSCRQSSNRPRWEKPAEDLWPDSNMWASWKQLWPKSRKLPWLYLVGGSKHAICNCILAPILHIRHKCPKSEIIGRRLATARIESTIEPDDLRQSELTVRYLLSLEVDSSKLISPFAGRHITTEHTKTSAFFADGNIELWSDDQQNIYKSTSLGKNRRTMQRVSRRTDHRISNSAETSDFRRFKLGFNFKDNFVVFSGATFSCW